MGKAPGDRRQLYGRASNPYAMGCIVRPIVASVIDAKPPRPQAVRGLIRGARAGLVDSAHRLHAQTPAMTLAPRLALWRPHPAWVRLAPPCRERPPAPPTPLRFIVLGGCYEDFMCPWRRRARMARR